MANTNEALNKALQFYAEGMTDDGSVAKMALQAAASAEAATPVGYAAMADTDCFAYVNPDKQVIQDWIDERRSVDGVSYFLAPLYTTSMPTIPNGWKLIPIEMTREMVNAHAPYGSDDIRRIKHDWSVSLQNAPNPPFVAAPQASQPIGQPEQEKCGGREYCSRMPFCGCGQPPLFPERDPSKPAEQQGIFRKFDVRRVDGSDAPGGKHHGCRYFVLDMDHDAHAPAALRAYADECAATHPQLAADLRIQFGASNSQPVSGAGMTDEREAAELQTLLQELFSEFRKPYPAGLYAWARAALLSASGQAGKRDILAICDAYESGMGHGLQRDGHKSGSIFANPECGKAYEIGYCEGEERAGDSLKAPKLSTPAQQTEAPVNVPEALTDADWRAINALEANLDGDVMPDNCAKALAKVIRKMRTIAAAPAPVQTEAQQEALKTLSVDMDAFLAKWKTCSAAEMGHFAKRLRTLVAFDGVQPAQGAQQSEKDAERLDWISLQDFDELRFFMSRDTTHDGEYGVMTERDLYYGKTLREAIDAAIAQEKAKS